MTVRLAIAAVAATSIAPTTAVAAVAATAIAATAAAAAAAATAVSSQPLPPLRPPLLPHVSPPRDLPP